MKKILNLTSKMKLYLNGNSNNQIIAKNVTAAFVVKGAGLLVSFFTMPTFIHYFNDQQVLGVWYTVLSVITWVLSFDLGIGNGLRNHLVVSIAENDREKSKALISSAYCLTGTLVLAFAAVGLLLSKTVNWNSFFGISSDLVSGSAMLQTVRYVYIGILLQLFFNTVSSVLYALQKSAFNNVISLIISISQLIFVLLAPSSTPQQNLLTLSRAYIFITTIPYIIASIILFSTLMKGMAPKISSCTKDASRQVFSIGILFFACQIFYMLIVNTNEFFVTSFTAPQNTVEYSIYNKLFSLAGTLVMLTMTSVWSMVTKAIAEKQYLWLKALYRKAKKGALVVVLGELIMLAVLQPLINLWLGSSAIKVNYLYGLGFAVWGSVFIYQSILSTFACGTGRMKLQALCYGVGLAFKFLFLKFAFIYSDAWILVVVSNIIIILPYCLLQDADTTNYLNSLKEDDRIVQE